MNTEINLLEKKEKKYIAPLCFIGLFLVGFLLVFGLIFFQKSSLDHNIATGENKITEMEITLAEQHNAYASREKLERLENEAALITEETMPLVGLYHYLTHMFPKQDQLEYYYFDDESSLVIEAAFSSLEDIAHYIAKLDEQRFIIDTDISEIVNNGSSYHASLAIRIDEKNLVEEFDMK